MSIEEFKEYVKGRCPLDTEEIHRFMDEMSDRARRVTFRLNTAYHTPDEVRGLLPLWGDARYKKDIRLLLILEGCMLAGIVIIAFKNWQVSAILLVNDLILDFIGIFGQYNTKKNK